VSYTSSLDGVPEDKRLALLQQKHAAEVEKERERLTNCTVDGVAGFRRLVAGSPSAGREFGDSIDRKIGQARNHRTQVVSNREAQAYPVHVPERLRFSANGLAGDTPFCCWWK
jgi:hypothetical protein